MNETMLAAQSTSYGPAAVIVTGLVPRPSPGRGDVQVKVASTTINGSDIAIRAGAFRMLSGRRFPKGVGMDFTGVVSAVGVGVTEPVVGARVWGLLDHIKLLRSQSPVGSAAEYLVVSADRVAELPAALSFIDAAALMAGTTALTALRDRAHLQPGERLLVRGGTGGVGYVGVQLGRAFGAHTTALVSASAIGTALELGADVALDYRATAPAQLGTFDVIFDTVGSDMGAYRRLLSPTGRMVTITFAPMLGGVATVALSVVHGRRRIRWFSGNPTPALLDDYATHIESGALRALTAGTFDLEHTADAHRALEAGGAAGKQVVVVS